MAINTFLINGKFYDIDDAISRATIVKYNLPYTADNISTLWHGTALKESFISEDSRNYWNEDGSVLTLRYVAAETGDNPYQGYVNIELDLSDIKSGNSATEYANSAWDIGDVKIVDGYDNPDDYVGTNVSFINTNPNDLDYQNYIKLLMGIYNKIIGTNYNHKWIFGKNGKLVSPHGPVPKLTKTRSVLSNVPTINTGGSCGFGTDLVYYNTFTKKDEFDNSDYSYGYYHVRRSYWLPNDSYSPKTISSLLTSANELDNKRVTDTFARLLIPILKAYIDEEVSSVKNTWFFKVTDEDESNKSADVTSYNLYLYTVSCNKYTRGIHLKPIRNITNIVGDFYGGIHLPFMLEKDGLVPSDYRTDFVNIGWPHVPYDARQCHVGLPYQIGILPTDKSIIGYKDDISENVEPRMWVDVYLASRRGLTDTPLKLPNGAPPDLDAFYYQVRIQLIDLGVLTTSTFIMDNKKDNYIYKHNPGMGNYLALHDDTPALKAVRSTSSLVNISGSHYMFNMVKITADEIIDKIANEESIYLPKDFIISAISSNNVMYSTNGVTILIPVPIIQLAYHGTYFNPYIKYNNRFNIAFVPRNWEELYEALLQSESN